MDALEGKGIVSRRPQAGDRRRNVVELTESGRGVFRRAEETAKRTEQEFLAPSLRETRSTFGLHCTSS
jgi:DNA-binding MarR family transcriptional regulator